MDVCTTVLKLSGKRERFIKLVGRATKITFHEFDTALRAMGIGLRPGEMFLLFEFSGTTRDGLISADDIDFNITEAALWKLEVMQQLQNMFISGRMSLERAFRVMDSDGVGRLDLERFVKGMTMLNRMLPSPLTAPQMKSLYECVDTDQDGFISFAEFVESFSVFDSREDDWGSEKGYLGQTRRNTPTSSMSSLF